MKLKLAELEVEKCKVQHQQYGAQVVHDSNSYTWYSRYSLSHDHHRCPSIAGACGIRHVIREILTIPLPIKVNANLDQFIIHAREVQALHLTDCCHRAAQEPAPRP